MNKIEILQLAFLGDQLVARQLDSCLFASHVVSSIVLVEQTIFAFYITKIRLEMAEIQPKYQYHSQPQYGRLAVRLGCPKDLRSSFNCDFSLHAKFQLPGLSGNNVPGWVGGWVGGWMAGPTVIIRQSQFNLTKFDCQLELSLAIISEIVFIFQIVVPHN